MSATPISAALDIGVALILARIVSIKGLFAGSGEMSAPILSPEAPRSLEGLQRTWMRDELHGRASGEAEDGKLRTEVNGVGCGVYLVEYTSFAKTSSAIRCRLNWIEPSQRH
jgi:hypothetical protein